MLVCGGECFDSFWGSHLHSSVASLVALYLESLGWCRVGYTLICFRGANRIRRDFGHSDHEGGIYYTAAMLQFLTG